VPISASKASRIFSTYLHICSSKPPVLKQPLAGVLKNQSNVSDCTTSRWFARLTTANKPGNAARMLGCIHPYLRKSFRFRPFRVKTNVCTVTWRWSKVMRASCLSSFLLCSHHFLSARKWELDTTADTTMRCSRSLYQAICIPMARSADGLLCRRAVPKQVNW
jgi:hypothetical protein